MPSQLLILLVLRNLNSEGSKISGKILKSLATCFLSPVMNLKR